MRIGNMLVVCKSTFSYYNSDKKRMLERASLLEKGIWENWQYIENGYVNLCSDDKSSYGKNSK